MIHKIKVSKFFANGCIFVKDSSFVLHSINIISVGDVIEFVVDVKRYFSECIVVSCRVIAAASQRSVSFDIYSSEISVIVMHEEIDNIKLVEHFEEMKGNNNES